MPYPSTSPDINPIEKYWREDETIASPPLKAAYKCGRNAGYDFGRMGSYTPRMDK
jgi:hypothetical protein